MDDRPYAYVCVVRAIRDFLDGHVVAAYRYLDRRDRCVNVAMGGRVSFAVFANLYQVFSVFSKWDPFVRVLAKVDFVMYRSVYSCVFAASGFRTLIFEVRAIMGLP